MSPNDPGPGHIDAVSTADDWQHDRNSYTAEGWDEMREQMMTQEQYEAAERTMTLWRRPPPDDPDFPRWPGG